MLLFGVTGFAWAQAPATPLHITGENTGTARRFIAADKLAADGKWTEAVTEYQRILDEVGDALVPIEADHDVQARLLCHLRLAALPPEVLARYRERIDDQAARWLSEGKAHRDERVLRRIVDEAFVSRSTDQALDLLGELAFERGDFDSAEHWWRLIVRPASDAGPVRGAKSLELLYPDPHVDVARVCAKQLLARLFRGDRTGMADELQAYRKKHSDAAGDFAGHIGKLADTLAALAASPKPLFPPAERWTTFGGTPGRNVVLPPISARMARNLSPRRRLWRRRLVQGSNVRGQMEDSDSAPPVATVARRLAVEPVVMAGHVLVADPRSVTAYDLRTGQPTLWYSLPNADRPPPLGLSAPPDLRCTLTVANNYVYARIGTPGVGPPAGLDEDATSYLLCLSAVSDPVLGHYRWGQQTKKGEFFEGTPVVRDADLYVAITRFTETSATMSIACYAATTGRPRWRHAVEICERRGKLPAERYRHHLLTLAGPNVVYCSHSGAVIALDAATGHRAWAVRYPSRGDRVSGDQPSPRDLCPCVFADGLVLAAPADYDHILCLDAVTGQVVWRSGPVEVVQILGVSRSRLFFTTPKDIRALDLVTGLTPSGWIQPDDGSSLPPFGRGFLTADLVFWPTENGLRVLRQDDAAPADAWYAFIAEQGPAARLGNLTWADDCLVVAGPDDLTVYAPESFHLEANRAEVRAHPESATARYRLALAQAAAGEDAAAWESFLRAGRLARPQDRWEGKPIKEAASAARHELLLTGAAEAVEQRAREQAAKLFRRGASTEFTTPERIAAVAGLAQIWQTAGKPQQAVETWQSIVADPGLADALPLAARAINELVRAHGVAIYARQEQQAQTLLDGSGAPSDQVLERITHEYANSGAARRAWLLVAQRHEQAGRWGAAAEAFRQVLPQDQSTALAGLAQCYEHEHCWSAAGQAWRRLAAQHKDSRAQVTAVARLQRPPYSSVVANAAPLAPSWEMTLPQDEKLLRAEDTNGDAYGWPCFFTVRHHVLTCRDAATGRPSWSRSLPRVPGWLGWHEDMVLAADSEGIQTLRLADGQPVWDFTPSLWAATGRLSPINHGSWRLSSYRLSGGRLFFLVNASVLCAVAADTGRLLWAVAAPGARVLPSFPGGRFGPNYYAGEQVVVIQASGGKLWVLDPTNGLRRHELPTSRDFWPRPPLPLGKGRVCLVPDNQHLTLLEPLAGKVIWSLETRVPSVTAQAPQLTGDQAALLAIIDGCELARIDPITGTNLWTTLAGTARLQSNQVTLDGEAVYWIEHRQLQAASLADGRHLWSLSLPEAAAAWRLIRSHGSLLAAPNRASQEMGQPWMTSAFVATFPLELAWRDVPLVLCHAALDPGGLRLQMSAHGPEVVTQPVFDGLVVGTSGIVRAFQARP